MYANEPLKAKNGGLGRKKKRSWGARERATMSFLIVIAFFLVFILIILTEVFMIDERGRGGVVVRHVNVNNRFGESMPDYDDVKDDYAEESGIFVRENRFGSAALKGIFKKNTIKNADPLLPDKFSIGIPVAPDSNEMRGSVPYGQMLPSRIEQNLPPYPNDFKPTDGSWQVVNGTRYKFFVFSAFYDRRDARMIRVIGATKTRGPEKVWCRLWYPLDSNGTKYKSASVMARVKVIRENWNLKYSAVFILCPLKISILEVPYSVSIVSKLRAPPANILILRNTDADPDFANQSVSKIPNQIAVCIKPLHFEFDNALYLLEFLEFNGLLGVSHFTLYNHTIGPRAACVLDHYVKGKIPQHFQINYNQNRQNDFKASEFSDNHSLKLENVTRSKITVNLLPWNLRMRSQKEIRTEGLFASLNDCLYRSMYRYSHVALIDLDEFIIPRHNDSIKEMLDWLSKKINNRNTGAYSFQNAFFYLQFGDDELMYDRNSINPALRAALVTQKKTRRRSKLHPQKQRSKYICKPESVIEAGNHFVWEFCPGRGSLNVPADAAILHHYRVCEFGGDDCIKTPSTLDRTAQKYSKQLIERVQSIYEFLKEPCKLADLPIAPTKPPPTIKRHLKIRNPKTKSVNASISPESLNQNEIKIKKITFR